MTKPLPITAELLSSIQIILIWYVSRADSEDNNNQHDKAIADYSRAIELDPKDPDYLGLRADSRIAHGEYGGALADFTESIRLAPDRAGGYLRRGDVYLKVGQFHQAGEDYDRAVAVDPTATGGRDLLLQLRRAIAICDGSLDVSSINIGFAPPPGPDPWNGTAPPDPSVKIGRCSEAPDDRSRQMVEVLSGFGIPQDKIADVIGVDGKTLRKHYATELQRGAATVEAKLVGNLLKLASGSDGTVLQADIHDNKLTARMRANRGYALKLIGSFAQARTDLDEAVRLNPSEPFFQQQRADIYLENGAFDEAIRTYSKALQHTAGYARFWRAVAYALKGDIDRAISEFKTVYADGDSDAIFKTAAEWALGFAYF